MTVGRLFKVPFIIVVVFRGRVRGLKIAGPSVRFGNRLMMMTEFQLLVLTLFLVVIIKVLIWLTRWRRCFRFSFLS